MASKEFDIGTGFERNKPSRSELLRAGIEQAIEPGFTVVYGFLDPEILAGAQDEFRQWNIDLGREGNQFPAVVATLDHVNAAIAGQADEYVELTDHCFTVANMREIEAEMQTPWRHEAPHFGPIMVGIPLEGDFPIIADTDREPTQHFAQPGDLVLYRGCGFGSPIRYSILPSQDEVPRKLLMANGVWY